MRKLHQLVIVVAVFTFIHVRPSLAGPNENTLFNTLSFNPVVALSMVPNLTFERALNERISVFLTEGFQYSSDRNFPYAGWDLMPYIDIAYLDHEMSAKDTRFNNFNIAGLNYFLWGKAVAGLYCGPRLLVYYSQKEWRTLIWGGDRSGEGESFLWAVGPAFGYHWVWPSGFSMGLEGGVVYYSLKEWETPAGKPEYLSEDEMSLYPFGYFTVGYSF